MREVSFHIFLKYINGITSTLSTQSLYQIFVMEVYEYVRVSKDGERHERLCAVVA